MLAVVAVWPGAVTPVAGVCVDEPPVWVPAILASVLGETVPVAVPVVPRGACSSADRVHPLKRGVGCKALRFKHMLQITCQFGSVPIAAPARAVKSCQMSQSDLPGEAVAKRPTNRYNEAAAPALLAGAVPGKQRLPDSHSLIRS